MSIYYVPAITPQLLHVNFEHQMQQQCTQVSYAQGSKHVMHYKLSPGCGVYMLQENVYSQAPTIATNDSPRKTV